MKIRDLRRLAEHTSTVKLIFEDGTEKSATVRGVSMCKNDHAVFSLLFEDMPMERRDFFWSPELSVLVELCDDFEASRRLPIIGIA